MDILRFSRTLADYFSTAISTSKLSNQQVAIKTGIPWTTFYRRINCPETSYFTIPEMISVCEALDLDFIEVLTNVEKLSREVE